MTNLPKSPLAIFLPFSIFFATYKDDVLNSADVFWAFQWIATTYFDMLLDVIVAIVVNLEKRYYVVHRGFNFLTKKQA